MRLLQDNAIGSILNGSGSINDGVVDRKAILGFQQTQNRHLLDMTTKVNNAASQTLVFQVSVRWPHASSSLVLRCECWRLM